MHSADSPSERAQAACSVHVLAAVDRKSRAGDKIALVAGEKNHAPGNIHGRTEPTDGYARDDLLQHVGRHGTHHFSIDIPWRDCIDCYPKLRTFLRQGLGETVNSRLCSGIVHLAVLPSLSVDATYVYD